MDVFDGAGKELAIVVIPGTVSLIEFGSGLKNGWVRIRAGSREAPIVQSANVDFVAVMVSA